MIQVKIFTQHTGAGGDEAEDSDRLTKRINTWIKDHHQFTIEDIDTHTRGFGSNYIITVVVKYQDSDNSNN